MRLPDDYEDHGGGLTPTVISAIVAVTIFVAVILTVVLIMNRQPTSHQQNNTAAQTENVQQAGNNQTDKYPDTQDLITGSTLTPSDLDFWDMYPELDRDRAKEDMIFERLDEWIWISGTCTRRLRQHHCRLLSLPKRITKRKQRKRIPPLMENIPW